MSATPSSSRLRGPRPTAGRRRRPAPASVRPSLETIAACDSDISDVSDTSSDALDLANVPAPILLPPGTPPRSESPAPVYSLFDFDGHGLTRDAAASSLRPLPSPPPSFSSAFTGARPDSPDSPEPRTSSPSPPSTASLAAAPRRLPLPPLATALDGPAGDGGVVRSTHHRVRSLPYTPVGADRPGLFQLLSPPSAHPGRSRRHSDAVSVWSLDGADAQIDWDMIDEIMCAAP